MDKLINQKYASFDYLSRYNGVPYYYDTVNKQEVFGIGQQMDKSTPYVNHKLRAGDTLESLALKYYNNPTYWWILAYFNSILDPFIVLSAHYSTLRIPNITSIIFKNPRS
jgi:hypothetical protein